MEGYPCAQSNTRHTHKKKKWNEDRIEKVQTINFTFRSAITEIESFMALVRASWGEYPGTVWIRINTWCSRGCGHLYPARNHGHDVQIQEWPVNEEHKERKKRETRGRNANWTCKKNFGIVQQPPVENENESNTRHVNDSSMKCEDHSISRIRDDEAIVKDERTQQACSLSYDPPYWFEMWLHQGPSPPWYTRSLKQQKKT